VTPYIAPHSPVADWRAVPQGHGYGNYFDPVTGTWATVTRTTPKTARVAADKLVDVPAGYLALEPWSLHKTGGVGLAAIIEESRTNAYLDSYFAAADISAAWASDGTLTRSTDVPAVYGTHTAKVVLTGGAGDSNATKTLLSQERPYSAAQNVTTSAWVRGSATGLTVQRFIEAIDASNAVLGTVVAGLTLGAWGHGTLTYANLPTGTVKTRSGIRAIGVDENDTVTLYASAAQSEVGSFATSYIPTTTAAVTRNADVVTVPTAGWGATAGTFSTVVGYNAASRRILTWTAGITYNEIFLQRSDVTDYLRAFSGGVSTIAEQNATFAPRVVSGAYSVGGYLTQATAGVIKKSSSVLAAMPANLPGVAYVGSAKSDGYLAFSGPIARVTVYDKALTDEQLAAADMTTDLLTGLDTARITNEVTL